MKKCCWIKSDRGGPSKACPFGLPITDGCRFAGASTLNMCPLEFVSEEKREDVEKANKRIYIYYRTNSHCTYAADIMETNDTVNCNFGDTAAGMHMKPIEGSPLYAQTFSGVGLDGLYAYPLGMYADNNESRNLFQGLFSLVGSSETSIVKESCVQEKEEKDTEECREEYEREDVSTGKTVELSNRWNPRKHL